MASCKEAPPPYNTKGYKRVRWNGKQWYIHRKEWTIHMGPIPADKCLLHLCDNPKCYELTHLRLGTIAENNHDMRQKQRHAHGESAARKLGASQVRLIRIMAAAGIKQHRIAHKYGIHQVTVSEIVTKKIWRHI